MRIILIGLVFIIPILSITSAVLGLADKDMVTYEINHISNGILKSETDQRVITASQVTDFVTSKIGKYKGNEQDGKEILRKELNKSFTSREISHLEDVQHMFVSLRIVRTFTSIYALLCLVMVYIKPKYKYLLLKSFFHSGILLTLIAISVSIAAFFSWSWSFDFLHQIFFKQGTWQFYSDDLLIILFPKQFWIDMASYLLGGLLIFGISIALIGKLGLKNMSE